MPDSMHGGSERAAHRVRTRRKVRRAGALAALLVLAAGAVHALQGEYHAHDPSRIVKCKDRYWVFMTGQGVACDSSTDGVTWRPGPPVFAAAPAWIAGAVPGKTDAFLWAPDVVFRNGRYCLYYAASRFGRSTSAIGLATNRTLDPSDSKYHWTDQGPVVVSTDSARPDNPRYDPRLRNDTFNAIDPGPVSDGARLWLCFGSYWSGIKLIPLDPRTGKRRSGDSTIYSLAYYDGDANHVHAIEAPYIHRHGGWYYLFVNWDYCCQGVNSTYNIRVGRSRAITGPYRDRSGVDMRRGGGTLFLGTQGREIGPGHAGVFSEGGRDWVTYHYYDGADNGAPKLGIRRLLWSADGWPVAGEPAAGFSHPAPAGARMRQAAPRQRAARNP